MRDAGRALFRFLSSIGQDYPRASGVPFRAHLGTWKSRVFASRASPRSICKRPLPRACVSLLPSADAQTLLVPSALEPPARPAVARMKNRNLKPILIGRSQPIFPAGVPAVRGALPLLAGNRRSSDVAQQESRRALSETIQIQRKRYVIPRKGASQSIRTCQPKSQAQTQGA